MIKLIATDMDGTLLNDDHATVSQRNVDALQRAAEQGIEVVISSGRPWSLLQDIADRVGVVRYVVASNGASVLDRQTGEQHAVTQKVEKASAVDQRMAAAAVTDDGRFLIPIREREPYTDVYDYALIDADAFLQGSTDYTPVKPVE